MAVSSFATRVIGLIHLYFLFVALAVNGLLPPHTGQFCVAISGNRFA
jgi:hypothetical protein